MTSCMSKYQLLYSLSDIEITNLYTTHGSLTKILLALNIKRDPRCRRLLSSRLSTITGNNDHSTTHRPKPEVLTYEKLKHYSETVSSISQILTTENMGQYGSNFTRVSKLLKKYNLSLLRRRPNKWTEETVYCEHSQYHRRSLSSRVRADGWLPYQCKECGNTGKWLNKELPLHLDHIDGESTNNQKHNLRWLCPNCHAQTPTYGPKNRKHKDWLRSEGSNLAP
jgi:5-methylcytosine-specific restriction endonuclease McrA